MNISKIKMKPRKIITNEAGWDTKIFIDGKDANEIIGGIFGIDVNIRVDTLPKITIHRYGEKIDFESKAYKLDIVNHKPKKISDKISDITNFSSKGNREYTAKEEKSIINKGEKI